MAIYESALTIFIAALPILENNIQIQQLRTISFGLGIASQI